MKKLKYLILLALVSCTSFYQYSFGMIGISVNAGTDNNSVLIRQKINLIGSVTNNYTTCSVSYKWERNGGSGAPITIYNSTSLTGAYFYGPDETIGGQNILIDLKVILTGCIQADTYTDSVTYTVDPYTQNVIANDDITTTAGSTISLSGQKYGDIRTCTSPTYQRIQTGTILSPDLFDESSSGAKSKTFSFTAPTPTTDTTFMVEFVVTCPLSTKKDTVNITVQGGTSGRSISSSQAGTQQAENDFSTLNINNIKIIISRNELLKGPGIEINWNKIGEEGIVFYELEISNNKYFDTISTNKLISNKAYLIENELFKISSKVYLRVRAVYKGINSPYSNIIEIYDNDDWLNQIIFKLKKFRKISF